MKKRAPLVKHWRLEFNQQDLVCCVANTIQEALETVAHNYSDCLDLLDIPVQASTRAKTLAKRGHGVILLFTFDKLQANILCHEVTHATHFYMQWMGIKLSLSSDEAFAYCNDMLFRFVAQWWQAEGLKVALAPPGVPELIYKPNP